MRPQALLSTLLTLAFLSSCATEAPKAVGYKCPPLKQYDKAMQTKVADEHDALPSGDPMRVMIDDYIALRNGCRAISR